MLDAYFDSENFIKIDFNKTNLKKGEYDNCIFEQCNFENTNLSNIHFIECEFVDCNFSNSIVKNTAFRAVKFSKSKMIGIKFYECNTFLLNFTFDNCQLNFSSFYKLKIPQTLFNECNLEEVDFTEANLNNSRFHISNFNNAIFNETNLEKTDFKTAFNFSIDPENNMLKSAKFSKENIGGLLSKYKVIIE
jgi:uncharacterized protein YjbI with pentapeptide repeats|tara:strand:+ start:508 stop:1080 length:573 start_codon:yes stop_codon:yes gene_type:complete